jgi:hypothetical protein
MRKTVGFVVESTKDSRWGIRSSAGQSGIIEIEPCEVKMKT